MTKTLLIDLDGVLNTYCGNYKENLITQPREGVKEFLEKLSKDYKIELFTARNTKVAVEWLIKNQLDKYITNVTNVKNPFASVILDDRALNFNGDFHKAYKEIISFKPHWM